MKFKVGDKVRVITDDMLKDKEAIIVEVRDNICYYIEIFKDKPTIYKMGPWYDWELELVERTFTKSDLKDGMVVEFRDHPDCPMEIVVGDLFVSLHEHQYMRKCDYDDNLICRIEGKDGLTIDKVYIINTDAAKDENEYPTIKMDLIWERKEEPKPKEMTVKEIEEALGYPVKVVNEEGQ